MHVITLPLDPAMSVYERGRLRDRTADEWRAQHGSTDPVGVDLVPNAGVHDGS